MMNSAAMGLNTSKKILDDSNRCIDWDCRVSQSKERRKSEVKKHTFQFIFAICIIFAVLFETNHFISKAGAANKTELPFKYYKNISVERGDTLDSIARTYADKEHYASKDSYIHEIRLMNHLDEEDKIYAGDYLIIPYYSNELK